MSNLNNYEKNKRKISFPNPNHSQSIYQNNQNQNTQCYNPNYSVNNNTSNYNIFHQKYPNSNFDFEKKMDYLLLTNAFTKLKNENKSYEELESLVLKLEISNIKYSKKLENMKYEIIRLNQTIIDLNSTMKEKEIEIKLLNNKISFLDKEREINNKISQYENSGENFSLKKSQNRKNDKHNLEGINLIEDKYLVRTSNDFENQMTDEERDFKKEYSKNSVIGKNKINLKKSDFDNDETIERKNKNSESIFEDTDSSLIEGFENNESLLDSIKHRENKNLNSKKKLIIWKNIISCNEIERKIILEKLNNFDELKKENKKLKEDLEDFNKNYSNYNKEKSNLDKIIKEKDDIIEILYNEIDKLKRENFDLFKSDTENKYNKSNKFNYKNKIDNNVSDILTQEENSQFYSPAITKIKHFIKDTTEDRNPRQLNTPSTVNKNYFYKNNVKYDNYFKQNKEDRLDFDEEYEVQVPLRTTSIEMGDKQKSALSSKNNFTFQEADNLRQNDSSHFNSIQNFNNSDFTIKNEDKKLILKNLEDLKKDLDFFLREYGIKEQYNSSSAVNNGIDYLIDYKFKEIRYITVNLKKINIIFKSLFVEFTKKIAINLEKMNENFNKKIYFLENKINDSTNNTIATILKEYKSN